MKPLRLVDEISIYGLVCPRTHEVRYVGRAIDPTERFQRHLREDTKASAVPSKRWVKECMMRRERPGLVILERTTFANVDRMERKWVRYFQDRFPLLKNVLLRSVGKVASRNS